MDIEAYLDGSMNADEKAKFEQKLNQDAALRKEMEQFRELKTNLAWHFAAKDVAAANVLRAEIAARRRRWLRFLLTALLVVLAGLLVFRWLSEQKPALELPTETPALQKNTSPSLETPVETPPPIQKTQAPRRPMAGNIKPRQDDLLRNLPAEEIPAATASFFEQQWADFVPAVPEIGGWVKPLQQLRSRQVASAYQLLQKAPASDTASYLLAVSELMLKRPSAAQELLYPLTANKKWQTEVQYLLVWAYLMEGNSDFARASLKVLPTGFRDKKAIEAFLAD